MRQVIIKLGEDGYWLAECPSLPGCISQGQSKKEAIESIQEAVEGLLKFYNKMEILYLKIIWNLLLWQYEQTPSPFW